MSDNNQNVSTPTTIERFKAICGELVDFREARLAEMNAEDEGLLNHTAQYAASEVIRIMGGFPSPDEELEVGITAIRIAMTLIAARLDSAKEGE